jgi:hypothetical protein
MRSGLKGQTIANFEIYVVPTDGGTALKVSGLIQANSDVQDDFRWLPDGSLLAQRTNLVNVHELYASQPDGSANTRLSGTLAAGGDVASFDWLP